MKLAFFLGAIVIALASLTYSVAPDVKRYIRIRTM